MYAAYYMCRYNFRFATPGMQAEFGFTTTQIGDMLGIWSLTYGTGQLVTLAEDLQPRVVGRVLEDGFCELIPSLLGGLERGVEERLGRV